MDSEEIKETFNKTASAGKGGYENRRWFSDEIKKGGYEMTKEAIREHFLKDLSIYENFLEIGPGSGIWTKLFLENNPKAICDLVDISGEMLALAKVNLKKSYDGVFPKNNPSSLSTKQSQAKLVRDEEGGGVDEIQTTPLRPASRERRGTSPQLRGGGSEVRYFESDFIDFEPDKKYDVIFSCRALEYFPDKKEFVKKLRDLTKPGSSVFIITKTPHYKRAKIFRRQLGKLHQGQIEPQELKKYLLRYGFSQIEIYPVAMNFPGLKLSFLNRILFRIFFKTKLNWLSRFFAESYAIKCQKL